MLKVYNTLSKTVDPVTPNESGRVKMYTCGPTVYRDAHIGNLQVLPHGRLDSARVLEAQGHRRWTHVKNITDVGHMRQEMLESAARIRLSPPPLPRARPPPRSPAFYTDRFLSR